jgi:hypothetical protein
MDLSRPSLVVAMKTLDVLNKQDLQQEYKLSLAFIKRHSRDMGGIGKPMVFDRELVEMFLREMMTDRIRTDAASKQRVNELKSYIDRKVRETKLRAEGRAA